MSRIWSMMDVGKRSLMNSQMGLQTVSHNVANRTTEGFSRQTVNFKANEPLGSGKTRIGMGARPGEVARVNNPYIEKQLEREGTQLGYLDSRADMMARVEQVYNEQTDKGLNQYMSNMFNSFRELSNNPESLAARTMVKESGDALAKDFRRVTNQLNEIQNDVDFRLATKIEEVNQMSSEIAQLNEKIQTVELSGGNGNDERDRRDLLVKKMGELANIRYSEGKDGQVVITAGNTAVLVSGFSHRDLFVASTPGNPGKREGHFDVFYKSTDEGTPVNITGQLTGGQIGGLLDVRDRMINGLHNNMDEMAYTIAGQVNDIHREGFSRYNLKGGEFFVFDKGKKSPIQAGASNREIAAALNPKVGAAATIGVSQAVAEDVGQIAAAGSPNSPGDNRIANVLSALQYKQVLSEGTATVDEYYSNVVGQVGIEAQRANTAQTAQKDMVSQLRNIRESISGVSLDEETTKMIEFQKAFDASARIIKTADEMMDTVLNLKRL